MDGGGVHEWTYLFIPHPQIDADQHQQWKGSTRAWYQGLCPWTPSTIASARMAWGSRSLAARSHGQNAAIHIGAGRSPPPAASLTPQKESTGNGQRKPRRNNIDRPFQAPTPPDTHVGYIYFTQFMGPPKHPLRHLGAAAQLPSAPCPDLVGKHFPCPQSPAIGSAKLCPRE